jgi:hypothetical protein
MTILASTAGQVHSDLGANHHMWTYADLYDNDWLVGNTRTASFTWFGGYIGTMAAVVVDANTQLVGTTDQLKFGVNGTAFGGSDRTDNWSLLLKRIGPGTVPARVLIAHGWTFEARTLINLIEVYKVVQPLLALLV